MHNRSPIYNLFHQEIRACAEHLLEMSQKAEFSTAQDTEQVLGRFNELRQFATKVREDEYYLPLREWKHYLENTMLKFADDQDQPHSMRLSEAVTLLSMPAQSDIPFNPSIVRSLQQHFITHFLKEAKPGRALFRKLDSIKKI